MARFSDRHDAGRQLASLLEHLRSARPLVLGLARGGVPVAAEVADHLGCDMDVLTVRKIGVPDQPELAMGAIASGGMVVPNAEVVRLAQIDPETFERAADRARAELADREKRFRESSRPMEVEDRHVVLVDDGIATGSTMRAAIEAVQAAGASAVSVGVPVAAPQTIGDLEPLVDEVVAVLTPARLGAVGAWFRDFAQTRDDEVRQLLLESRRR